MKVVVAIPAYNEESDIVRVIKEIQGVMKETKYSLDILVIDDGSSDDTVNIAKSAGAKVFSNKTNRGLAETFKKEMEECLKLKPDIIFHTDADGQYPSKYIPEMIKMIESGYDLVLGSRFKDGKHHDSFVKMLGNVAFAKVISRLTRTKITDSTTGFRAFTREVAEKIIFVNTFTYTQEQIIKASRLGFKIGEIAITRNKTRESRLFRNSFQYAIKAWINIFRIYRDYDPIKFFGKIGLSLIMIGVIIGVWLFYRFIIYGKVGHIPMTVLTMLLIITGIQIITFGFLAYMKK